MRTKLAILTVLLNVINMTAQNKSSLGFDLGGMLTEGEVRIMAGYGFHDRWSVRYSTAIGIEAWKPAADHESESHKTEFGQSEERSPSSRHTSLSFLYWPKQTYDGMYMGIGGRYDMNGKAGCIISIGYCIPIWKGLSAALSYNTDITASIREMKPGGEGMTIELCWTIGKH